MGADDKNLNRRQFLQIGGFAAVAPAFAADFQNQNSEAAKEQPRQILNFHPDMRYRRLGNTDIYLSVLSLGGNSLTREIAHYAIDHGVNLIHMSPAYKFGGAIKELGAVTKEKRQRIYIALKDSFGTNTEELDQALKTLNTDYVDFIMFNRHDVNKINHPEDLESFEKWRQAGKVRFAGLTSHDEVKACVAKALQGHFYTLIQPVLNQPGLEAMAEELRAAQQQGVGILAMKTMKGIRNADLQQAFLKKICQNPAVTSVCKGFNTFEAFNSYLKIIHENLSYQEDLNLYRYARENRSQNCMMCGECKKNCPFRLEIPTVLRCKDYYHDQQGDPELAKSCYAEIAPERRIHPDCLACKKCQVACPNGIPIASQMVQAHQLFTAPDV